MNEIELFQKIPKPAWIYDLKSLAFLEVNEAAVNKYGYSKDEFLRMTLEDIRPPKDVPRLLNHIKMLGPVLPHSATWRHCKKDGTIFYVQSSSNEITFLGKTARIVVIDEITQVRNYEQRLYTQYEVVKVLAEFNSVKQVIPKILQKVCEGIEFNIGEYWAINKNEILTLVSLWAPEEMTNTQFVQTRNRSFFRIGEELPGFVYEMGKPVSLDDLENSVIRSRKLAKDAGLKSAIGFPVYVYEEVVGVMCFYKTSSYAADQELIQMFETIGRQIGNFLNQKKSEKEIKLRVKQQAAIANLGREALEGIMPADLMKEAMRLIKDVFHCEYIQILELLDEENLLLLRAGIGWQKGLIGNAKIGIGKNSQAGYTLLVDKPVIVDDMSEEKRFQRPSLLFDYNVVSGMSVVIRGKEKPFGVLSVHTTKPHSFNEEDVYFIGAVANILATSIERKKSETSIEISLKEKEILLKEIHHRVKNNLQVISSLLSLQSKSIKDPEAIDIFQESQNRIRSMSLIHEKLYQTKNFLQINFEEYAADLIKNLFESYYISNESISRVVILKNIYLNIDIAISLGLILNELISNSLKYAFNKLAAGEKGEIKIEMKEENNKYYLSVKDNGCGLPQNINIKESSTLGLQLVSTLVEQIKGKAEVKTTGGTEFIINFTV